MNEFLIKTPDEVKHLSNSEIEELYERYLNGEKNSVLVSEYKIDVNPNKLITVLPPKQLQDISCPYCNIPMFEKRKSKSHSSWQSHAIECYKCGHKIFTSSNKYRKELCSCEKCVEIQHQQAIEKANRRKEIIAESYCLQSFKPIPYKNLTFTQKLLLLTLFRMQTDEDFNHILSLNDPSRMTPFTPSTSMDQEFIRSLYSSSVILVDPLSNTTAFCEDNPAKSFYLNNVQWIVNISIDNEDRSELNEVYNKIYYELRENIEPEWEEDLFTLIMRISTEEVLQYLRVKTEELNVTFTAEKKTKEITEQLLIDFSVSEIYYFVKKSVEDAHIFYSKGSATSKKHAGNIIPGKMLSLGERALDEQWDTYKYNRDSRAPRSYLSQIVFDFLLKSEDAGFNKAIGRYWQQEVYPKYFANLNSSKGSNLYCTECGSTNLQVSMHDSQLSTHCRDCGFNREYIADT